MDIAEYGAVLRAETVLGELQQRNGYCVTLFPVKIFRHRQ